jgi:SAM-dependent methyltransferase
MTSPAAAGCPTCGASAPERLVKAREMMFGTRASFTYGECGACGSLRLVDPPADLGPYYPPGYYTEAHTPHPAPGSPIHRALLREAFSHEVFGRSGRFARPARHIVQPPDELRTLRPLVRRYGIRSFSDRILDVGCGWDPARLCALRRIGFRHLEGIDPFVPADTIHHGIPIRRLEIEAVAGPYDVIMFHHSLEHVRDPLGTLAGARRALAPDGRILVRTPLAGSLLWQRYGADWWELDAPRHLVVLSVDGLRALAARAGLEVAASFFDSSEREFIGSEQIRRDIAEYEPGSWFLNPAASPITGEQVAAFHDEAVRANAAGTAGRGGFVLRAAA